MNESPVERFPYSIEFLDFIKDVPTLLDLLRGSDYFIDKSHHNNLLGILKMWENDKKNILDVEKIEGFVLDIGSGNGFLLRCIMEWSRKSIIPYGIDINKERIDSCKKIFKEYQNNFICADILKFDFEEKDFSGKFNVILWNVWIDLEPKKAVWLANSLKILLRNNGKIVLMFPNYPDVPAYGGIIDAFMESNLINAIPETKKNVLIKIEK